MTAAIVSTSGRLMHEFAVKPRSYLDLALHSGDLRHQPVPVGTIVTVLGIDYKRLS